MLLLVCKSNLTRLVFILSSAVASNNTPPPTNQQLLYGESFVYVPNDCNMTNDHTVTIIANKDFYMYVIGNVIICSQKNLMMPHWQIVKFSVWYIWCLHRLCCRQWVCRWKRRQYQNHMEFWDGSMWRSLHHVWRISPLHLSYDRDCCFLLPVKLL